jgi:hypothetical protein
MLLPAIAFTTSYVQEKATLEASQVELLQLTFDLPTWQFQVVR